MEDNDNQGEEGIKKCKLVCESSAITMVEVGEGAIPVKAPMLQ